jgi:uncharacterized protein YjbJ (UPF0337 family)
MNAVTFLFPSKQVALKVHVPGRARRNNTMKDSTKDKIEGTTHEVKGAVKQKVGHAVNNPDLEAEGKAEKTGGKIQKKVGDVEKVLEK